MPAVWHAQVEGAVTYNGQPFKSFQVSQTAAYVPQTDSHMAQLTVRETFDFGARVQGTGTQSGTTLSGLHNLQDALEGCPRMFCCLQSSLIHCRTLFLGPCRLDLGTTCL